MPAPAPGVEGRDWVHLRVRCPSCGKDVILKAAPDRAEQRWACPFCHARHARVPDAAAR
jgi:transposase-like protein